MSHARVAVGVLDVVEGKNRVHVPSPDQRADTRAANDHVLSFDGTMPRLGRSSAASITSVDRNEEVILAPFVDATISVFCEQRDNLASLGFFAIVLDRPCADAIPVEREST